MKVIRHTFDFQMDSSAVVLGKFDGIHRGHQALLRKLKQDNLPYSAGMITFDFSCGNEEHTEKKMLFTSEERVFLAEQMGFEWIVELPFTDELRQMPPKQFFYRILLEKCHAKAIYVGEDYHFGYKRAGTVELLLELCEKNHLKLGIIPEVTYDRERISSSRLRAMVEDGLVSEMYQLLGYPYFIQGTIGHGRQLGRTIGFPTANLCYSQGKLLPKLGVYDTYNIVNGKGYFGITNVGTNPTVKSVPSDITVESNLLDFDDNIYGEKMTTYFLSWRRPQMKFDSFEQLQQQLLCDKEGFILCHQNYMEIIGGINL